MHTKLVWTYLNTNVRLFSFLQQDINVTLKAAVDFEKVFGCYEIT